MEQDEVRSAEELAEECANLARLSERSGFKTGAYLLKMACLEFMQQQEEAIGGPNNAA